MLPGMSSSEGALAAAPAQQARRAHPRTLALSRLWPEPLALALLAGLLNFWDLSRNGWANTYYAAAVRSMSLSWHNFPFASFDPSGVMTVDKPPLALWIETASVKLIALVVAPGIAAAWAWQRPPHAHADGARADRATADGVSLATPRCARVRAYARARRGPLAGIAARLLVGGAWPLLVELTPAAHRPWISGTADDTVLSLIFGYNGLGRIEGQSGGCSMKPSAGRPGGCSGFALLSGVAILLACRLRHADPRSGWLLAVGGAFGTTALGPAAAAAGRAGDTRGEARPRGRLLTPGAGPGGSLAPGVAGHSGALP